MKFQLVAALAALSGVQAGSTIECSDCPPSASTPDMVTRSPLPTSFATEPPLTAVSGEPAMATSAVTTTSVYTVSSCPPSVTDCPIGSKTTKTMTAVQPMWSKPSGGAYPSGAAWYSGRMMNSTVFVAGAGSNGVSGALALAAVAAYLL